MQRTLTTPFRAHLPPLGRTLDFLRHLWEIDHALQRRSKRMESGLTGPQRLVLGIVGRFPQIPPGEIAALLAVHPSTLTGILQRLERAGCIQRRPDPRDRRRSLLGLTALGRELDADPDSVREAVGRVLERLPPEDVEAAGRVLADLAGELGDAPDESHACAGEQASAPRPARLHAPRGSAAGLRSSSLLPTKCSERRP